MPEGLTDAAPAPAEAGAAVPGPNVPTTNDSSCATTAPPDAPASHGPEPDAAGEEGSSGEEDDGVEGAGGEGAAAAGAKKKKKKKNKKKKKAGAAAAGEGEGADGAAAANGSAAHATATTTAGSKPGAAAAPTKQTTPPSVPVRLLFPSGTFPEGEWQSYKDDNLWRETSAEKRELERLQWDMINQVRQAAEVHRQVRAYVRTIAKPGGQAWRLLGPME